MPAKTTTRVGQSTARPVLTAAQKKAAAAAKRREKLQANDRARAAAAESAAAEADELAADQDEMDAEDAALEALSNTTAEAAAAILAAVDADPERAEAIMSGDDVPKTSTLAAARAASTAAATAGELPGRSPRVAAARASAQEFTWERSPGHPLDPNELLVTFLIERCSPDHNAPNDGRPFINTSGRVFLHTEWFMAWIKDGYSLTPPKGIVTKLFRSHSLEPRAFAFPGTNYSRGLYQGPAPTGTENIKRRQKAAGGGGGPAATTPPSPQIELLGDRLCLAIDQVFTVDDDPADPPLAELDKTALAWLGLRVGRHIKTLVS